MPIDGRKEVSSELFVYFYPSVSTGPMSQFVRGANYHCTGLISD